MTAAGGKSMCGTWGQNAVSVILREREILDVSFFTHKQIPSGAEHVKSLVLFQQQQ